MARRKAPKPWCVCDVMAAGYGLPNGYGVIWQMRSKSAKYQHGFYWFWIMVCSIPSISICFGSSIRILCQNDFSRTMLHKQWTWNIKGISMSYNIAAGKLPKQVRRGKRQELRSIRSFTSTGAAKIENTSWPDECWFSLQVAVTLGIQTYVQITRSGSGFNDSYIAAATMKPLLGWYSCYSTQQKIN